LKGLFKRRLKTILSGTKKFELDLEINHNESFKLDGRISKNIVKEY